MADNRRGGLLAVAVVGGQRDGAGKLVPAAENVTPCGRCRQIISELAGLGGTDPLILCAGNEEVVEIRLSVLLPRAFGPATLATNA